ncbi:MAG: hypothetical protein HFI63_05700 [Lachnospiraceae bacterium]|nr:hypothetical protein [Lachnospiraceae bacterium]
MRGITRRKKKGLAVLAGFLALTVVFAGCGKKKETPTSRGFKESELFYVEDLSCTRPEAMMFLLSQKSRYEAGYGGAIWDVKVGEQTFEEYMKENLKDFLVKMKCMTLMAAQYEVELGDEDEKRVSQAAAAYLTSLPEETKKETGIDKKTAEKVFREYYTASLLVEKLTADVSMEISEDEARVITVQQIFLSTAGLDAQKKEERRAEAQNLLARAQAGDDFMVLAKDNNESEIFERELSRGETDPVFEAAAFGLGGEEVSPVVETADGFYLIRCVNHYDEEKTAQNKEALGRQHREERFYEYYDAFVSQVTAACNESAWEEIGYRGSYKQTETDFYTIYSQYFPT